MVVKFIFVVLKMYIIREVMIIWIIMIKFVVWLIMIEIRVDFRDVKMWETCILELRNYGCDFSEKEICG